jgi:hypothetical protein
MMDLKVRGPYGKVGRQKRDTNTGQFLGGERKWMKLLKDQRVKSWIQSYPSYNVKSNKGYALDAFLKIQDLTIDELFNLPEREIEEAITGVVQYYVKDDKSAFARKVVDTVKSLFFVQQS